MILAEMEERGSQDNVRQIQHVQTHKVIKSEAEDEAGGWELIQAGTGPRPLQLLRICVRQQ